MSKDTRSVVSLLPEKVDFSRLDLKAKEVNVNKFEQENIAQQYDSLADALQKELIQNAWDARVDESKGKGWRFELSYDPTTRILRAEDFGTKGMTEQDWKNFNGLGLTQKKAGVTLGSKGQGKAVLSAVSEYVITETDAGAYRCGIWVGGQHAEYQRESRQLSHQGTLIIAYSIHERKDEDFVHEDLSNDDLMVRLIQLTWDDIIREYGAEVIYKCHQETRVPPLTVPDGVAILDQLGPQSAAVKKGRQAYGEITDLVLFCTDKELPEDMQGIAISVKGQTIVRYLPPALGAQSKRIYGRCKAEFLAQSELPNHSNFRGTAAWNQTRAVLRNVFMKYSEKFVKSTKRVDSRRLRLAGDVLDQVNQILEDMTELDPGSGGRVRPPPPPPPTPLPTSPYILAVVIGKREYKRGESAHVDIATVNGSDGETFDDWTAMAEIYDSNHLLVFSKAEKHSYKPGETKSFGFDYAIPATSAQGRYSLTATLLDRSLTSRSAETVTFQVEPLPTPPRPRRPGPKVGGGKGRGLRDISLFVPEEPGVPESLYDDDENAVVLNIEHPNYKLAMAGGETAERTHMFRCVANELLHLKVRRDMANRGESAMAPDDVEKYHEELLRLQQEFFARRAKMEIKEEPVDEV